MRPDTLRLLKWISGGLEAFWGIPILGGSIILSLSWTPLLVMLVLHIIIVVFSYQQQETAYGNIVGIVTSCIAWIPIVGMVMHIITAIVIFLEVVKQTDKLIDEV